MYIDIHSHLNFPDYDEDREEVIERMREKHVRTFTVGVNYETSKRAVELASEQRDSMRAVIGLHPIYTSDSYASKEEGGIERFEKEAFSKLVDEYGDLIVGVGECGLDYFHTDGEARKAQESAFRAQIEFALTHDLPLMLHIRPSKGSMDAYEDALRILKEYESKGTLRGDVHFFAGDREIAEQFLSLGFFLSFTGVVTFTHEYDEIVKLTPLERIFTETDAPYVSPAPYRGRRNEPTFVIETTHRIAELKGVSVEELTQHISKNVEELFRVRFS